MCGKTRLLIAPALASLALLLILPALAQEGKAGAEMEPQELLTNVEQAPGKAAPPALAGILAYEHEYEWSGSTAIPDDSCAGGTGVSFTLNVPDSFTVTDLRVGFNAAHTYRSDVQARLTSPIGAQVVLLDGDPGGNADDFDVLFADGGNPVSTSDHDHALPPYYDEDTWAPVDPLASFAAENAQGDWTLYVCDDAIGETGAMHRWALFFNLLLGPAYDLPYNHKRAPYKAQVGELFTYTLLITNTGDTTGALTLVTDTLPLEVMQVAAAISYPIGTGSLNALFLEDYPAPGDPIEWRGEIPAGVGAIIEIPVTVTAPPNTIFGNTAVITDPALSAAVELAAWTETFKPGKLYYYEDFDSSDGGYSVSCVAGGGGACPYGGLGDWQWGLALSGPGEPHSWPRVWGTVLAGPYSDAGGYPAAITSTLTSAPIDLGTTPPTYTVALQWWDWTHTEPLWDHVMLDIEGSAHSRRVYGPAHGNLGGWIEHLEDIADFAGQVITLHFRLNNDYTTQYDGWYIDDVAVHLWPPSPEFAGSWKGVDRSSVAIGDLLTYTVYITNSGILTSTAGRMFDQLPPGLQVTAAGIDGGGALDYGSDWVEWSTAPGAELGPGEDVTITIVATGAAALECDSIMYNIVPITDSLAANYVLITSPPVEVVCPPPLLKEGFGGAFPPQGWSIFNNGGNCNWHAGSDDTGDVEPNNTGGSGDYADADSNDCGFGIPMDTELWSPLLDLSCVPSPTLQFAYDYRRLAAQTAQVDISANGGVTWNTLWTRDIEDDRGPAQALIDLAPYTGSDQTYVRFRFTAVGLNYWWQVDDVTIPERWPPCPHVFIEPDQGDVACPGGTWEYPLTVTNASDDADVLDITLDGYTWPTGVSSDTLSLDAGGTAVVTVTVQAPWLVEVGDSDVVTAAVTGQASGLTDQARLDTVATLASSWEDLAPSPHGAHHTAVVYDDGYLYQIGGDDGDHHGGVYAYDVAGDAWLTRTGLVTPVYGIDGAAIGGNVYIPGGESAAAPFNDFVQVYSTTADSWSTVAPMTVPVRYHEVVALDGLLYVLGGQTSGDVYTDTVQIYDPATGAWSFGTPMTVPVAYAASGAIAGKIYLAGGYNGSFHAALQIYDPLAGGWSYGAPLPGGRVQAADGVKHDRYLILAGGGYGHLFATLSHALLYDTVQDAWSDLPEANSTRYAAEGDGDGSEFYYVGGQEHDGSYFYSSRNERLVQCPVCEPPEAELDFSPANPVVGETVHFTATRTSGLPVGVEYRWDFGDGGGDIGQHVQHAYAYSDAFTVVLTTSNVCDYHSVVSDTITVVSPTYYALTVAVDGTGSGAVEPPVGAHVYPSGTVAPITATAAPGSTFEGWSGDLGGTANPTSILMDDDKEITATFTVEEPCVDIAITSLASNSPVELGDAMVFTATVTGDTPITYDWDVDSDGTPEQSGVGLSVISYTYAVTGPYDVTLDVANNCPSTDTHSIPVTVIPVGAPITYDVSVNADDDSLSGKPGDALTYTLTAQNDGNVEDTFDVALGGTPVFTTTLSVSSIGPLGAGATGAFEVYVSIPPGVAVGVTDTARVILTSRGDASATAYEDLTTAVWFKVYLPLVLKKP